MGLDIDQEAIAEGREAYKNLRDRLFHYDGHIIPLEDGSMDVITLFDVLEHIPNPSQLLNEIRRVLRPGGFFIFQTPNKYINIPWEIIHNRSFTYWRSYHCSLQTLSTLKQLLKKSSFTDIRLIKYPIDTPTNRKKIDKAIGRIGLPVLWLASFAPLRLYPNFYGSARRPK